MTYYSILRRLLAADGITARYRHIMIMQPGENPRDGFQAFADLEPGVRIRGSISDSLNSSCKSMLKNILTRSHAKWIYDEFLSSCPNFDFSDESDLTLKLAAIGVL